MGGESTWKASRCEQMPREGESALVTLDGRPGGYEGGDSEEQVLRWLLASSLYKVVLSVYGAQEAAQLFNEKGAVKQGDCRRVTRLEEPGSGAMGSVVWCAVQECTEMQLEKWSSASVPGPTVGNKRARAGRRAAVI